MTTQTHRHLAEDIVPLLPQLRAFARMLAQERALADDLVQETVVRALSHAHQFQPGTNLKAWLTTILRNTFFTEKRSQGRLARLSAELVTDAAAGGGQEWHLHMSDFECALGTLPAVQREAIVLVGASGFSYEQAAGMVGCAVGTMKSRVSRARLQLQQMLDSGAPLPASWQRHLRFDWDLPVAAKLPAHAR